MVFVRQWNFNGAARLLSTTDTAQVTDPESDLGAALQLVLQGIEVTANLPAGGATGTLLRKASAADGDVQWGSLSTSDIAGLEATLATFALNADLAALSAVVGGKATIASVDAVAASVAAKASQTALDNLSATVAGKADTTAIEALTLADLADVSDNAPSDGNVVGWDEDLQTFVMLDLTNRFPEADPSTGQTLPAAAAPFSLFGFIITEGENPPAGLPLAEGVPIIGFQKQAPPSLVPILLDAQYAQTASSVVLTMPQTLDVGEKFFIAVGCSGEATVPDNFLVTPQSGSIEITWTTLNNPNTTAATRIAECEVTGAINSGQTITVQARISTTPESVVHLIACAGLLPNTADDALDGTAVDSDGSSSSNMGAIQTGNTAALTSDVSVAIAVAFWSSGSGGTTRVLAGTNGFQELEQLKSDNGSSARSLGVFYKVLSSTAAVQFTSQMTASDTTTGQHSCQLAVFKGA